MFLYYDESYNSLINFNAQEHSFVTNAFPLIVFISALKVIEQFIAHNNFEFLMWHNWK